jgi:hypothetical protein
MKQLKDEFYSLYYSPDISGVVISWKMGGTGNVRGLHMRDE